MGVKPFIKSISPDDPIMKPVMETFGFDGYGRFIAVMDFCRNFGIDTLDIDLIVKQAKSNKRGAAKLLPMFQECLTKVLVKFGESLPKVLPNIDQSLPKLEAQNPHGSTRDLEEKKEEKEEKRTAPPKFSAEDEKTAQFIFEKVSLAAPEEKTPNISRWAETVRLMREQDKRTHEQIQALMSWVSASSFWSPHILSPEKLRKRWGQLDAQRRTPQSQVQRPMGSNIPGNAIVPGSQREGRIGKL